MAIDPDYEIIAADDGYPADGYVPPQRAADPFAHRWADDVTRGMPLPPGRSHGDDQDPADGYGRGGAAGYDDGRGWEDQRGYGERDVYDQTPSVVPTWPQSSYHNGIAHHGANGSRLPAPVSPSPVGSLAPHPAAHVTEPPMERTVTSSGSSTRVDYDAVRLLRTQIGEALTRWLRTESDPNDEDIQREREQLAVEMVARYSDMMRRGGTPMTADDEAVLLNTVRADMIGLGRLQKMLIDQSIEEVHILGCDRVRITRHGGGVDSASRSPTATRRWWRSSRPPPAGPAPPSGRCPPPSPPSTCNCPTAAGWPRSIWSATGPTR